MVSVESGFGVSCEAIVEEKATATKRTERGGFGKRSMNSLITTCAEMFKIKAWEIDPASAGVFDV